MAFVSANSEQVNFLRRCWQTAQYREGAVALIRPLRESLYRASKRFTKKSVVPREAPMVVPARSLGDEAKPVFAQRTGELMARTGLESLFSDVDKQLRGVFRLAGARDRKIGNKTFKEWGDPEDQHSYHRLYWAVRYARAAAYGHVGAIEGLERDWLRWRSTGVATARAAYTVSERIASLVECLYWLREAGVTRFATPFKKQIWADARLLAANIEYRLGVHNHLLNNARALFLASATLDGCQEAASWRRQAFEIWDTHFPQLVLDDGAFAEQSSHYHLLLCRTALEYVLASRIWNHTLPEGFVDKAARMFELMNDLLRSDGTLARFGHNSPDHAAEDLWGLPAAAFHWGLLQEAPRHRAITPLTIYYCGASPRLPSESAPWPNRLYQDSGFAFLRSTLRDIELVAHADPRPEPQAHGDAGRGSFELWWRGQVVIQEPGSFLRSGDTKSIQSQSGAAQNVTCLNGLAPGVSKPTWDSLPQWYWRADRSEISLHGDRLQFRCGSFRRLRTTLMLERSWWFDSDGNLTMEEEIDADHASVGFPVRFESRLHLGEGPWEDVQWNESAREATLCSKRLEHGTRVRITVNVPGGVRASLGTGATVPEYGIEKATPVLELRGSPKLPLQWTMRCEFIEDGSASATDGTSMTEYAPVA